MRIFYSAKANIFYRDDFHGTRLITVPDPEWKRPLISVPDPEWSPPLIEMQAPDWVRPLIEAPNPDWHEGAVDIPEKILIPDKGAIAPTVEAPDPDAQHPEIMVPDTSANPPMIDVPNPKCLLPPESELVDVTFEEHQEIQKKLATTLSVLSSDKNGRPITVPAPGQTPEQILSGALLQRDRLIGVASTRIAPLQDAVDLDDATPEDVSLLKKWKQYRVAVNRVPEQEGFPTQITWPPEPQ